MALRPTSDVPFHAAMAFKWWRLSIYIYLPALALTLVTALLKWDDEVVRLVNAQDMTTSQAQTSLAISLAFAVLIQSATAFACWWMAGKLLYGSSPARMVLSVAAAVFVINAALSVAGLIGRNDSPGLLGYVTTALIVLASIVAATATAQSYRGERNSKFFVTT